MATFVIGDYEYTTLGTSNVHAKVNDITKSSYQDIPASVTYGGVKYSVIDINNCFNNCTSLTQAPTIPNGVTNMDYCFNGCTSLTGDIYVYCGTLSTLSNCFYNTTRSITLHAMNNNIGVCDLLAATANNDNVLVNIHSKTPISFTDTQMNYMTDEGLKPLSLQTDASLVQCEIPDLVNGGTIITNVNDALIDLYNRAEFPVNTWYIGDGEKVYIDNLMIQRNGNEVYCGGFGQGYNYYALCAFSVIRGGRYRIVGAPNYTITYRINGGDYTDIPSYMYDYSTIVSLNKGDACTIYLKIEPRNYSLVYIPVLERVGGGGA